MLSWIWRDKNIATRLARPNYVNRHQGCTALIIGTGPSLSKHWRQVEELRIKYNAVTLGANNVSEFLYPSYHCFTNRKRYIAFAGSIESSISRVLLSPYLSKSLIKRHYRGPYETLMYINDHEQEFHINDGVIQASCRTAGVLLIGVAIVMGAERIFVAGMDGYNKLIEEGKPIHHYDNDIFKNEDDNEDRQRLLKTELLNARFLTEISEYLKRLGRQPFSIITPTVHQAHFKSIEEFL